MKIKTRQSAGARSNVSTFALTDEQIELFSMFCAHCRLGTKTNHNKAVLEFLEDIEDRFGTNFLNDVCERVPFKVEIDPHTLSVESFSSQDICVEFIL